MQLAKTRQLVRVQYVEKCASTNDLLRQQLAAAPELKPLLVVTDNQTAGRGRQGRTWQEIPGKNLATSYFLPTLAPGALPQTWVPLCAGAALSKALQTWVPALHKWPNDVLVAIPAATASDPLAQRRGGAKIAGILCENTPAGIIIGAGINIATPFSQLPAAAASLRSCRVFPNSADFAEICDQLLAAYCTHLQRLVGLLSTSPETLRQEISAQLATLGQEIRATTPAGTEILGTASGLGPAGELLVKQRDQKTVSVQAADIEHLRLAE